MTRPQESALARLFQPKGWRLGSLRLRGVALPGGATLFQAGDTADEVFYLRAGRLGVTRHEGGSAQFLGIVRPGEIVGEMAAISGAAHTAEVTALRDSELYAMPREVFLAVARREPRLMMEVARLMVDRARVRRSGAGDPTAVGLIGVSRGVRVRALAETLALALAAVGCKAA